MGVKDRSITQQSTVIILLTPCCFLSCRAVLAIRFSLLTEEPIITGKL